MDWSTAVWWTLYVAALTTYAVLSVTDRLNRHWTGLRSD
jgi:hypothetical protein